MTPCGPTRRDPPIWILRIMPRSTSPELEPGAALFGCIAPDILLLAPILAMLCTFHTERKEDSECGGLGALQWVRPRISLLFCDGGGRQEDRRKIVPAQPTPILAMRLTTSVEISPTRTWHGPPGTHKDGAGGGLPRAARRLCRGSASHGVARAGGLRRGEEIAHMGGGKLTGAAAATNFSEIARNICSPPSWLLARRAPSSCASCSQEVVVWFASATGGRNWPNRTQVCEHGRSSGRPWPNLAERSCAWGLCSCAPLEDCSRGHGQRSEFPRAVPHRIEQCLSHPWAAPIDILGCRTFEPGLGNSQVDPFAIPFISQNFT